MDAEDSGTAYTILVESMPTLHEADPIMIAISSKSFCGAASLLHITLRLPLDSSPFPFFLPCCLLHSSFSPPPCHPPPRLLTPPYSLLHYSSSPSSLGTPSFTTRTPPLLVTAPSFFCCCCCCCCRGLSCVPCFHSIGCAIKDFILKLPLPVPCTVSRDFPRAPEESAEDPDYLPAQRSRSVSQCRLDQGAVQLRWERDGPG